MQRSKQQALMFLLGAVLVGGALGFSADHVFNHGAPHHWARRQAMYDDLGLSQTQRSTMDSLLDDRNCQIATVMKPVRPQLDSIRKTAHQQVLQILTADQREKLEQRVKEAEKRETKTTNTCR